MAYYINNKKEEQGIFPKRKKKIYKIFYLCLEGKESVGWKISGEWEIKGGGG